MRLGLLVITLAMACFCNVQQKQPKAPKIQAYIYHQQDRPIDTKLFRAIRDDDAREVNRLLAAGADANANEAN